MAFTNVRQERFGSAYGNAITLYTLRSNSLTAKITNYGGIVVSLEVPDREGRLADVVLGYDRLDPYITNPAYFGAIVGRYANRIADARFSLHGKEHHLARNDGRNSLHGGFRGFDKRVWQALEIHNGIELTYESSDQEEGYPGTLYLRVKYTVGSGELRIDYSAQSDRETVINLTNHSYFNLGGHQSGNILDHELELDADVFTPIDSNQIPTGEFRNTRGTVFDFTAPAPIGSRIAVHDEQLRIGHGYDHNWVLRKQATEASFAARCRDPKTGRKLEVLTTEPGIQFYSGNLLDGSIAGKNGFHYGQHAGLCLETQHFPDSPNAPNFPSTQLRAGDTFESATIYSFSTD